MSRTPSRFTQADISRAVRAAKAAGAAAVLLQPDGTIRIELKPSQDVADEPNPWDEPPRRTIIL